MTRSNAFVLLSRLCDGQFHSGQALADAMGVSRTSIASYVKQLMEKGVEVYSVKGRGYRLSKPMLLLDEATLKQRCPGPVYLLDEIGSTNAWLMARLNRVDHGTLVCCEYQNDGRGRRGRHWVSPIGGQLAFSTYWQHHGGMEAVMGLSLVVGIVIAQVLRDAGFNEVGVKWPNDLYVGGRKLGGILIEMNGQSDGLIHLVVGIGLNIDLGAASFAQIDQACVDLTQLGEIPSRTDLLVSCAESLDCAFRVFSEEGIAPFIDRWSNYDVFANQAVRVIFANQKKIDGIAKGIDAQGNLLLEIDGQLHSFLAGEVSLRAESSPI
jgi:BirA family biotin operon repressor/biotin-[acetyl-CoA-carboxylase] ligase